MECHKLFKFMVLMALSLLSQSRQGSSLFIGGQRKYNSGDSLSMDVTSLVSFMQSPLSYYSLPFCKPREGVQEAASSNLGKLLMGYRDQNSPYRIKMNNNGTVVFLCQSRASSADEVDLWKKRIDEMYRINFVLDDLLAMRYIKSQLFAFKSIGFQVGSHRSSETYYVYNHLEFKVLVHKVGNNENGATIGAPLYTVVGFQVTPCSVRHEDSLAANLTMYDEYLYPVRGSCIIESKEIKENESISFTYRVTFVESDLNWTSRWDAYSLKDRSGVQAISLMNSTITTIFFAVNVLIIFWRRRRQNRAQAGTIDAEANAPLIQKSYGPCKLEDLIRAPDYPMLLCAATGTGVQILGMAILTLTLAALGFVSSAPRGTLLMLMVSLYTFLSVAAGFTAACLWRNVGRAHPNGWIPVSVGVACIIPIIAFLILASRSFLQGTTPLAILTVIWLGIALPLTLVGGYIGSRLHRKDTSPTTNVTHDKSIPRLGMVRSFLFFVAAFCFSFGVLNIPLSFILSSLRKGYIYNDYWFLCIVVAQLLIVCSALSIMIVNKCLLIGDLGWWWKSFVAVCIFAHLIHDLVVHGLKFMSGPGPVSVYISYALLISLATMLATGAAGLLSTFWFIHHVLSN